MVLMSALASAVASAEVLINMGNLYKFSIVARPSKQIKSPYVAEIITNTFSPSNNPFYNDDYNMNVEGKGKEGKGISAGAAKKAALLAQKAVAESLREKHEVYLAHAPAVSRHFQYVKICAIIV